MFGSISKVLNSVKNGAVEAGAKAYLNQKIGNFGSVTKFQLDPRERTLLVEVELKGESSPISVRVGSYELIDNQGTTCIAFHDVQASREWIGLAVEQYVAGRRFPIPDSLRKML